MRDRRRPGDHAHPRPAPSGARDRRRRRADQIPEARADRSRLTHIAALVVLGLLVAGCSGSSKPEGRIGDAKPFADSFVHRLVEVGTWAAVEPDVSAQLTPQLRSFQAHIRQDGVKRVSKAAVLRHDCPPAPAVDAGKDCFVYVLSGRQVVPIGGVRKLSARSRLWVEPTDDTWRAINYDYGVLTR